MAFGFLGMPRPAFFDWRLGLPDSLELILYAYRARNSSHEGDCYYKDRAGNTIQIKRVEQVEPLVDAVNRFVLWIDSIA